MSTTTDAAVAWLREQVQARKALALDACDHNMKTAAWRLREHPSDSSIVRDGLGDTVVYDEGPPLEAEAAHIVLNDPQDVIARCEAELTAIDLCERVIREDEGHEYWSDGWSGLAVARLQLAFVASGYRHHPGYGDHWGSEVKA